MMFKFLISILLLLNICFYDSKSLKTSKRTKTKLEEGEGTIKFDDYNETFKIKYDSSEMKNIFKNKKLKFTLEGQIPEKIESIKKNKSFVDSIFKISTDKVFKKFFGEDLTILLDKYQIEEIKDEFKFTLKNDNNDKFTLTYNKYDAPKYISSEIEQNGNIVKVYYKKPKFIKNENSIILLVKTSEENSKFFDNLKFTVDASNKNYLLLSNSKVKSYQMFNGKLSITLDNNIKFDIKVEEEDFKDFRKLLQKQKLMKQDSYFDLKQRKGYSEGKVEYS